MMPAGTDSQPCEGLATGIEGLVVEGMEDPRHRGGNRGAVTGTLQKPEVLVAGRCRGSDLEMVVEVQAGHYRHPLRLIHRTDLTPADVEKLPDD
jgi:hypothetical protein